MTSRSEDFANTAFDRSEWDRQFQLFTDNVNLLIDRQSTILNAPDYFYCQPEFASCNWPYVGGSGPLYLGFLIFGWTNGHLIEKCLKCSGKVLLTSFAGSPLSGSCHWYGLCLTCRKEKRGNSSIKPFSQKVSFIISLRASYQRRGKGLSLEHLIAELKNGKIRGGNLLAASMVPGDIKLELASD